MYRDTGFLTFDRHPAEVVALARRGLTHQFRTEHKQLTRTQATHISQRLLSILHKHHQERSFSSQQAVHQWKNKIYINTLVDIKREEGDVPRHWLLNTWQASNRSSRISEEGIKQSIENRTQATNNNTSDRHIPEATNRSRRISEEGIKKSNGTQSRNDRTDC